MAEESKPELPIQPGMHDITPQATTGEKNPEAPQKTQIRPKVEPTPRHHAEPHFSHPDPTPLWKIILELGALAVGISLGWIYYQQLVVMRGQLREITRQYPELKKSADAANEAATTGKNALVASNRPWLGVESFRFVSPTTGGNRVDAGYWINYATETVVKDFGPSPALSIGVWGAPWNGPVGDQSAWGQAVSNGGITVTKRHYPPSEMKKFSDEICAKADKMASQRVGGDSIFPTEARTYGHSGGDAVYQPSGPANPSFDWIGCISYRDQFKENPIHHTRFCFIGQIGQTDAHSCEENGGAD